MKKPLQIQSPQSEAKETKEAQFRRRMDQHMYGDTEREKPSNSSFRGRIRLMIRTINAAGHISKTDLDVLSFAVEGEYKKLLDAIRAKADAQVGQGPRSVWQ